MSTPYKPVTIFHDTLSILEFILDTGGPHGGPWPGDGVQIASDIYDVADMLPAVVNAGNDPSGNQVLVGDGGGGAPEARYVLDWNLMLGFPIIGQAATDFQLVLQILSGASAVALTEIFCVSCVAPPLKIDYGPPGNTLFDQFPLNQESMHGTVRVTGRALQAVLTTFGTSSPDSATCGVYLRPF